MNYQFNDAKASIENNAPAMAQQVRTKSSIESKVAHNEVKTLFVSCNGSFFSISELGNDCLILQENDSWWCVAEGDPDRWSYEEEKNRILIPFANPESWRSDVAALYPSADKSRISLYKVLIEKLFDKTGKASFHKSFVMEEQLEPLDLSTPESNQLADVLDELPF